MNLIHHSQDMCTHMHAMIQQDYDYENYDN